MFKYLSPGISSDSRFVMILIILPIYKANKNVQQKQNKNKM